MPNLRRGSDRTSTPDGGTSVQLDHVRRQFGDVVALDDLSLEIDAGELVALLGPSGCGKTTALRILAGFERPDAGRVLLDGQDITNLSPNRREMGMVFQAYSLFPNLSLVDNVAFGLRMRGRAAGPRRARARELLDLVGLADAADRYPHQLSGGQQQRVALARAIAIEPRVLLLDEPLSALDARVRATLRVEIRRLQQELGITTLFVTHDQAEALSMADRVGVMNQGHLEQLAAPREIYRRPTTPFVATFVGTVNRLRGRLGSDGTVEVLGQRVAALVPEGLGAGEVDVLVRPEGLDAVAAGATPDAPGSPATGGATATVREQTFLGATVRLRLSMEDTEVLVDVPSHRAALDPGSRARLILSTDQVLVAPAGTEPVGPSVAPSEVDPIAVP
ncbi:MAG TPA: ABC transporter ATP-binding protein [Solirubrobacteraceae bacterium]|nr:ABC transporter ATP-binding protein [Solirubrobacteraceae bacterium]